jgi:hypothetical protein
MKDYIIDVVVTGTDGSSTVVAQSSGTLSNRPIVNKHLRRSTMAEAALTGVLECLKDLSGFLGEGDIVDANLHCAKAQVTGWITKGSGNARLDAELRQLVQDFSKKGISVAMTSAPAPRADLVQKASMALAMGM